MIDPPARMPGKPLGAKGCQRAGLMACAAPMQKITMAAIFMITMVVFTFALSRTPRTRIQVTPMVIRRAGTLNHPAGPPGAGKGGNASWEGKWNPNTLSNRSWR